MSERSSPAIITNGVCLTLVRSSPWRCSQMMGARRTVRRLGHSAANVQPDIILYQPHDTSSHYFLLIGTGPCRVSDVVKVKWCSDHKILGELHTGLTIILELHDYKISLDLYRQPIMTYDLPHRCTCACGKCAGRRELRRVVLK